MDCFLEGENLLVNNPDVCIDCGLCEPEVPAEAIRVAGVQDDEIRLDPNRELAQTWPNITRKIEAFADADRMQTEPNTDSRYSSAKPAPR